MFSNNALQDDLAKGSVSSLAKFPAGPMKIPSRPWFVVMPVRWSPS